MTADNDPLKRRSEYFPPSDPVMALLTSVGIVIARMDDRSGTVAGREFLQMLKRQTGVFLKIDQTLTASEKEDVKSLVALSDHLVGEGLGKYALDDAEEGLSTD